MGRGRCVRERHAFDADHIAAIDNTTRKLLADGRRPVSAGFWFALGHLTIVVVLAAGIAAGVRFIVGLTADGSSTRVDLGVVSTSASGLFLYLIGILNLVALVGIARVYRQARAGAYDAAALDGVLDRRGLVARLLRPLMRSVRHPAQMYPVGLLFGIGFDTATEVTLRAGSQQRRLPDRRPFRPGMGGGDRVLEAGRGGAPLGDAPGAGAGELAPRPGMVIGSATYVKA